MNNNDWERKYRSLLSKFRNAVRMAFEKGYEKGMADQQLQSMEQQQAEMQEELAAAQGMGGMDVSTENPVTGARQANDANLDQSGEETSELDQHLGELESIVAKSENMNAKDLRKSLKDVKKKIKTTRELAMLKNLNKSLYKNKSLLQVKENSKTQLNKPVPRVVNEQHKIVKDMIKKWDASSLEIAADIEGAVKKDEK